MDSVPERGARLARRDKGAYRQYSTEEERRQTGCPARKALYVNGDMRFLMMTQVFNGHASASLVPVSATTASGVSFMPQ